MTDYRAVFPAREGVEQQLVSFAPWARLGDVIALQVIAAFEERYASMTPTSRLVRRQYLNKLLHFLEGLSGDERPASLDAVTSEHLVDFAAYVAPVKSTRTDDWAMATSIVTHACQAAGRTPPAFKRSPWTTTRPAKTIEPPPEVAPDQVAPPPKPSALGRKSRALLAGTPLAAIRTGGDGDNLVPLVPAIRHSGPATLAVFFPARGEDPAQEIVLSEWLALGSDFARTVAGIFLERHKSSGNKTRTTRSRQLRPLKSFLQKLGSGAPGTLAEISAAQLAAFKTSLDEVGSPDTRAKYWYLATTYVEDACTAVGRKPPSYDPNPWPGSFRRTEAKTEVITTEAVGAILKACIADMSATLREADEEGYAGPTLPDLLPFIICFTFWTIFNAETAVGMRRSDVKGDVMGRIALVGRKPRASQDQVASFAADDDHICSPPTIIANVERITSGLRERLPMGQRDYLFVGRMMEVQRTFAEVKPFALVDGGMQKWYRDRFCKKHGLEPFNLRMIRTTGGVIVNRLFGDDQKTAQLLMNHLSIDTTDAYVGREALRSENLRLADQMEKRQRFVRTGGARDVRDQPLAPQSAATPGFVCADPFDPPANLGQDAGMCAAYGACPTCPLASVDRLCATSLAFSLRLRNQIRDAHLEATVDPHRWTKVWKQRLKALDEVWLPQFGPSVRAAAAERIRDVSMVPLPDIQDIG